jgi:hypothetical protein
MNINEMNEMLKTTYGVPKTMQELIMENLDAPNTDRYYRNEFILKICMLSMNDYLNKRNVSDIICGLLGLIVIIKIDKSTNNSTEKIVYLNDFDKSDDFYIYFLPQSYDVSKLSTNNDIPIYDIFNHNNDRALYYSGNDLINPYKLDFFSIMRSIAKESIQQKKSLDLTQPEPTTYEGQQAQLIAPNINTISVSDDEINKYILMMNDNRIPLLKCFKLIHIAPYIILYTKQELTTSSQIKQDMKEMLKPIYYTDEFVTYTASSKSNTIFTADFIDRNNFDNFGVLRVIP